VRCETAAICCTIATPSTASPSERPLRQVESNRWCCRRARPNVSEALLLITETRPPDTRLPQQPYSQGRQIAVHSTPTRFEGAYTLGLLSYAS
jgi:hypothetical protein